MRVLLSHREPRPAAPEKTCCLFGKATLPRSPLPTVGQGFVSLEEVHQPSTVEHSMSQQGQRTTVLMLLLHVPEDDR